MSKNKDMDKYPLNRQKKRPNFVFYYFIYLNDML